jgi:transcriptional regulator with XRE-family HTH domain
MQTIGERLEDARKRKGISIREAAEATKIRSDYLQKFEGNQFDIGLTEIYVRGFLHNYAEFLHLPADRILADFGALGHSESRPRQPSREVYGRMDVSVASAEDRGDRAPAPAAEPLAPAEAGRGPGQFPRHRGSGQPPGFQLDPALVFKGGIALAALLVVVLAFWLVRMFFSHEPKEAEHELPLAAAAAPAPADDAPLYVVATKPVRIKVARQSDGSVLFQNALQEGDRQSFPNEPLFLTATEMENLQLEYKGQRYNLGLTGYKVKVKIPAFPAAPEKQP